MKAVVLAAGEGTRLRPFTSSRPKVMIPVANRPILEYVVKALVRAGIKDIVLVVGYKRERIMSYFGDGRPFSANISYVHQVKQLGTANALRAAKANLEGDFLVVAGDNIIDVTLVQDLLRRAKGNSMIVTSSDIPSKYGVVSVEGDLVVDLVEKPTKKISNVISTGVYHFEPSVFAMLDEGIERGETAITNILSGNLDRLQLHAVKTTGKWMDAVYPWDLLRLNSAAMDFQGQQLEGKVEAGAIVKGDVQIGEGSRIRSGCYVEGPVVIGQGCDIGPNVTIMPSTSIGNGVSIGPFTYIEESLICSNVSLSSHSHLSHSVFDEGTVCGPALQCPVGDATSRIENEFFPVADIGALVGESATLGAGVVLEPGCIIGAGSKVASQKRVSGTLDNRSIVI